MNGGRYLRNMVIVSVDMDLRTDQGTKFVNYFYIFLRFFFEALCDYFVGIIRQSE